MKMPDEEIVFHVEIYTERLGWHMPLFGWFTTESKARRIGAEYHAKSGGAARVVQDEYTLVKYERRKDSTMDKTTDAQGKSPGMDIARVEADAAIMRMKDYRHRLDATLQNMKGDALQSREKALAITNLQQAIMWLGMCCKELNDGVSCYPEGYNPESAKVDPTPDDVKL